MTYWGRCREVSATALLVSGECTTVSAEWLVTGVRGVVLLRHTAMHMHVLKLAFTGRLCNTLSDTDVVKHRDMHYFLWK